LNEFKNDVKDSSNNTSMQFIRVNNASNKVITTVAPEEPKIYRRNTFGKTEKEFILDEQVILEEGDKVRKERDILANIEMKEKLVKDTRRVVDMQSVSPFTVVKEEVFNSIVELPEESKVQQQSLDDRKRHLLEYKRPVTKNNINSRKLRIPSPNIVQRAKLLEDIMLRNILYKNRKSRC
jgi:hypothetical protein